MTELVLAVNRDELVAQGIKGNGIFPFNSYTLNQKNYALLPRSFADNKTPDAIALGKLFPQILGYFQLMYEGKIFAYQRKGKEEGLLGKWSIGVGGHVSHEDIEDFVRSCGNGYPPIAELIYEGSKRELMEEVNLNLSSHSTLWTNGNFNKHADRLIHTHADPTSSVHVGIPVTIELTQAEYDQLKLDPAEFNNIKWIEPGLLKTSGLDLETWSQLLVDAM